MENLRIPTSYIVRRQIGRESVPLSEALLERNQAAVAAHPPVPEQDQMPASELPEDGTNIVVFSQELYAQPQERTG